MRRQKTGNRGAVLILVAALGILPVAAPGISPVTVLAATKKDVDDAKGKISSLEEEKKKAEAAIQELEGLKSNTETYVRQLDSQVDSLGQEVSRLVGDIAGKTQSIGETTEKLKEAGLRPGDVLYKVDGEEITGMDLSLVVNNYVKGEEGTTVTLTVYREEDNAYTDLVVTRRPIDVQTVSGKMLQDGIGYISVLEFDRVTDQQFKDKLEELLGQGMKKLIIDLRDNPGGEVTTVVSMADYILEDGGRILTVASREGTEEAYDAEDGHSLDIPMAILVNGNSASASEVFTGAMKDYGVATVVGTKTFGKGIVQTLIPLSDGSAIKLTTDHYYTPDGHDIHEKGIEPDVTVELSEEAAREVVIPVELDNQLQEAVKILREK